MLIRFINNLSGGRDNNTCHGDNSGVEDHTKEYPEGYYLCAMEDSAKEIYSRSTVARIIILRPAVQATVKDDN